MQTIVLGAISSLLAAIIFVVVQWGYVLYRVSKIRGKWNAYTMDEHHNNWIPMASNGVKAGVTRIRIKWWRLIPNKLWVDAENLVTNGTKEKHTGIILLDPPNYVHGVRTITQDARFYVQEIWILSENKIAIRATWADIPLTDLNYHILARGKGETELKNAGQARSVKA